MPTLIDNMVETDKASYTFRSHGEAEAFLASLTSLDEAAAEHQIQPATKVVKPSAASYPSANATPTSAPRATPAETAR